MRIERLSLRAITITILLVLGLIPIAHTFVAKLQFRDAALDSMVQSLSRVLEVATNEVIRQTHELGLRVGTTFAQRDELIAALKQARATDTRAELVAILDDPFIKGFVGAAALDLAKLRVYDLDLALLAESREGLQGLPPHLSAFLMRQAGSREGADRLKALGGLWSHGDKPLYSLLVPVGGLFVSGYLEVVIDPAFNLPAVSEMTKMPIQIHLDDGAVVYSSAGSKPEKEGHLPIEYILMGEDGQRAFHVVALENVETLYKQMHNTQVGTTVSFISLTAAVLLMAIWLFNRFLYYPVDRMMRDMEHITNGNLDIQVESRSLREFHRLAEAFNSMAREVRDRTITLQRLTAQDPLTGVANRRKFDEVLQREWRRAARSGAELSLAMIDIDYFKNYNDSMGHQAGDECLKRIAACIDDAVRRAADQIARYGGEEFVVILPETSSSGIAVVAEKVMTAVKILNIPHKASPIAQHVTLSIGVATLRPTEEYLPQQLVAAADKALYRAKKGGRNRIENATLDDFGGGEA